MIANSILLMCYDIQIPTNVNQKFNEKNSRDENVSPKQMWSSNDG